MDETPSRARGHAGVEGTAVRNVRAGARDEDRVAQTGELLGRRFHVRIRAERERAGGQIEGADEIALIDRWVRLVRVRLELGEWTQQRYRRHAGQLGGEGHCG